MGQNSTGVGYDFGQLGSLFTNLAKPVYPPKGHVIVAIQFLDDNAPTEMITETLNTFGPQFPGTSDTEATDANYLGVTEAACTGNRSTVNIANDTIEIGGANDLIKPGQYVLLVNDADTIDTGLTVDAETPTPVYTGPNQQGVKVLKVNGANITLDTVLTPTAAQTLVFIDEYHGAGGTTTEGVTFPGGITIYGRWTKVTPAADADGGVICYFGK
tara:strand:- start:771 stop:1415 length:645 start_codon:yes stop_codon:yes gene_type:complete